MKTIYLLIISIIISINLNAQKTEKFRSDFNYVSFLNIETDEWSEWEEGSNTFVFNVNENMDIAHYKPDGSVIYYRNLGELETNYTTDGEKYQIIYILNEEGEEIQFQLFDNKAIGAKLIWSNIIIQFALF